MVGNKIGNVGRDQGSQRIMALRAIVQNLDFILNPTGRHRKVLSKEHFMGEKITLVVWKTNCRRLRTEARDHLESTT